MIIIVMNVTTVTMITVVLVLVLTSVIINTSTGTILILLIISIIGIIRSYCVSTTGYCYSLLLIIMVVVIATVIIVFLLSLSFVVVVVVVVLACMLFLPFVEGGLVAGSLRCKSSQLARDLRFINATEGLLYSHLASKRGEQESPDSPKRPFHSISITAHFPISKQ